MSVRLSEKVNRIIEKLDGASGRLIVAAASDVNVRVAMETVCEASIKLGAIAEKLEEQENAE